MRLLPLLLAGIYAVAYAQDADSSEAGLEGFQAPEQAEEEDAGFTAVTSKDDGFAKLMTCPACIHAFKKRRGCAYLWYGRFRHLRRDFVDLYKAGCKKRCARKAVQACHIRRNHFRTIVGLRMRLRHLSRQPASKKRSAYIRRYRKALRRAIHSQVRFAFYKRRFAMRRHRNYLKRRAHYRALRKKRSAERAAKKSATKEPGFSTESAETDSDEEGFSAAVEEEGFESADEPEEEEEGFSTVTDDDEGFAKELEGEDEGEEGFALAKEDEEFGFELASWTDGDAESEEGFSAESESADEEE